MSSMSLAVRRMKQLLPAILWADILRRQHLTHTLKPVAEVLHQKLRFRANEVHVELDFASCRATGCITTTNSKYSNRRIGPVIESIGDCTAPNELNRCAHGICAFDEELPCRARSMVRL